MLFLLINIPKGRVPTVLLSVIAIPFEFQTVNELNCGWLYDIPRSERYYHRSKLLVSRLLEEFTEIIWESFVDEYVTNESTKNILKWNR